MSKFGVANSPSSPGATKSLGTDATQRGVDLKIDLHATNGMDAVGEGSSANGEQHGTVSPHGTVPMSPEVPTSPTSPTSPGAQHDPGQKNVAIDYMKARYEGGKPKEPAASVPKVFREPKKLDMQWDKVVDENAKKEVGMPAGFREQDLLQMVFMCMGVDTKSQYLSAIDKESQPAAPRDEHSRAEIESLPEITKSVRTLFESGKIAEKSESDASGGKKVRIYSDLPEWGVYESKPAAQVDGVVRAIDRDDGQQDIQPGLTSSLLSQWTRIGLDGGGPSTAESAALTSFIPTYDHTPGSGVFENQPATVDDGVVRSSERQREERIQRGLTKSLLGQWSTIGTAVDRPASASKPPKTYETAPGSGVFENEPVRIEGVVRESDSAEGEEVRQGTTRSLLSQWQNKGSDQPKVPASKRIIRVVEDEGTVAENEPVRRTDVVRADDVVDDEKVVRRGMAKALANEWKTKGSEGYRAERKSIILAEAEGTVAENEPVRRSDVVREDDVVNAESEQVQRGTTKMLLNQWRSMGSSQSSSTRTPIVIADSDGRIAENEPARRSDIAREDGSGFGDETQVQRGITKSLLQQWKNMGTPPDGGEFRKSRTPIVLDEGEGKVLENEPVRRTDVVHADEYVEDRAQVQRGITRSMMSQWKAKASEEFRPERKSIILVEDEGTVAENEPVKRTDVVREEDTVVEGEQVKRGMTKNLLGQWKNKATEEFKAERKPIVLAEAENCVAENEPVQRTDVVKSSDADLVEQIPVQRGTTKSLLNQWKVKSSEEFKPEKKQIILAEADNCVAENEPIQRTDVVRSSDADEVEQIPVQRGITKSLMNQWKVKSSEEFKPEKKQIIVAEADNCVAENEPIQRTDVVRSSDADELEQIPVQRGITKSLMNQWKIKSSEEFKPEKKQIILAEADNCVSENEPIQRTDVVRSSDADELEQIPVQRGTTKSLLSQWKVKSSEEFKAEKKQIILAEADNCIAENEPVQRTDVVKSSDADELEQIPVQRGTTKSLLTQWKVKSSEEFKAEKKPIILAEAEGKVVESEPIRRDDVIHADDIDTAGEQIQRGTTRNLKAQYLTKSSEEFRKEKTPINIAEAEGKILENEPIRRDDVVHCDDIDTAGELIQRGITSNLKAQYLTKSSEEFRTAKAPINVAEAEGKISENEPVRRSDVVHADDVITDGEQVERGTTRNMRAQWMTKSKEEFRKEKTPIVIAEAEGKVLENEPVRRDDVVHADDIDPAGEQIQRGITRNLKAQYLTKSSEEYHKEKSPIIVAEAEGKILENEPVRRDDVVHADDIDTAGEQIQSGITRNLKAQYLTKSSEEYHKEKSPIIVAEAEGKILENEPVRRDDVVREDDFDPTQDQVRKGMAQSLRNEWSKKGTEEFKVERKPIVLNEAEGKVLESEPVRRTDVIHSDDIQTEGETIRRGTTRNLLSQWKVKGTEEYKPQRKSIIIEDAEGKVSENEPVQRTDVVRESDPADAREELPTRGQARQLRAQWMSKGAADDEAARQGQPKPLVALFDPEAVAAEPSVVENNPEPRRTDVIREEDITEEDVRLRRGHARDMAGKWMAPREDGVVKEAFRLEMDIDHSGGGVFENEPIQLTGDVVRCSDVVEEVLGQRGQIRNIRNRYASASRSGTATPRKPPDMVRIDLADGPTVLENDPAPVDPRVVRSVWDASAVDETLPQSGTTRGLLQRWMSQQDIEEEALAERPERPAWMVEMEMTPAGSGVFENSPVVRTDVIREEDREPEMIPIRQTRRTRAMWSRLEKEEEMPLEVEARPPEMIRFTPPRDKSPPAFPLEEFRSVQSVTLHTSAGILPITSGGRPRSAAPSRSNSRQERRRPPSQPSTPGTATSQLTWVPSADVAAKTRAQIGSEVLKWHARRSSRSISFDDGGSGGGGSGSGVMSPTSTDASEWVYQAATQGTDDAFGPATTAVADGVEDVEAPPATMRSSTVLVFKSSN